MMYYLLWTLVQMLPLLHNDYLVLCKEYLKQYIFHVLQFESYITDVFARQVLGLVLSVCF